MDELREARDRTGLRGSGLRRGSGFTLIEVMVALGILAFGMLAMLAMQIHAIQGSRVGRHTSQASRLVKDQMETLHRMGWGSAGVADTGGWTAPVTRSMQIATGGSTVTEQTYDVRWRVTDVNANLKSIDVQVQWSEPDRPNRSYTLSAIRHNDP